MQKKRLLPPWSGCHSPRLGHTRHNADDLHLPSHTINRPELAGIDIGLHFIHTHLLTDGACSLRLIQGYIKCPTAYRHHIHRDTFESITQTLKTRWTPCIGTHLGKIKAHNHFIGNDLVDALANQIADNHPPDTIYTIGSNVSIGTWTWPYTLIPQTQGMTSKTLRTWLPDT
jgi:hypothetical protein